MIQNKVILLLPLITVNTHLSGGHSNIENDFFMISIAMFQAGNNSVVIFLCRKLLHYEHSILKLIIKQFTQKQTFQED
jgi:hypothetical protein